MTYWLVPALLFLSSIIMAMAWLGHLRFQHWSFKGALLTSWLLVLPEYFLNVYATRLGFGTFTGGQMALINLATGVVCVLAVSRWYLRERVTRRQLLGFALLGVALVLFVDG
jgi:uncharacterized protein (DUF486 family)